MWLLPFLVLVSTIYNTNCLGIRSASGIEEWKVVLENPVNKKYPIVVFNHGWIIM